MYNEIMESEMSFNYEKTEKNKFLNKLFQNLFLFTQGMADHLADISGFSQIISKLPPIIIGTTNKYLTIVSRSFNSSAPSDILILEDNLGNKSSIEITTHQALSPIEITSWEDYGVLPNIFIVKIAHNNHIVSLSAEIKSGKLSVSTASLIELKLLKDIIDMLESAIKLIQQLDGNPNNDLIFSDTEKLNPLDFIQNPITKNGLYFTWESPKYEHIIHSYVPASQLKDDEMFDVFTNRPDLLQKGLGTLFIYFQGIDFKHGSQDTFGNSSLSWTEELFSSEKKLTQDREIMVSIQHPAKKIGFDHFIGYIYPKKLTSSTFYTDMKALLKFLDQNHYSTVIVSFSNGATLLLDLLLDLIKTNDFDTLESLAKNTRQIICGGAVCETVDLEPFLYRWGKVIINHAIEPLVRLPIYNLSTFIVKSGGISEIISRVKYLFTLDNLTKSKYIDKKSWVKVNQIFNIHQTQVTLLADEAQRVVLPTGIIKWYSILKPNMDCVTGYLAKNIKLRWILTPETRHWEIKNLWTLLSLIGRSTVMRKILNFDPISNYIADNWIEKRLIPIS